MNEYHEPVLTQEVLRYLITEQDGVYVDATLGGGGHAATIMQHCSSQGTLIGIDRDSDALKAAQERLKMYGERIVYVQDNFSNVRKRLEEKGIKQVNGMLFDLGVSSHQIDEVSRGFSFQGDSRIDMRMSQHQQLDGWTVVNRYDEKQLSDIFRRYGEERFSRRIARRIVEHREKIPIHTTGELAQVVESVVGQRMATKSLARIFQAIRIEVNDELESLARALQAAVELVIPGGRIVVISYHSLEDRIVKRFFREQPQPAEPMSKYMQRENVMKPRMRVLTKKPVVASEEEVRYNSRARSAKLRAAERI
ncbi:MAG: 16S rRNA (cytosine(1402)-N(4))-methyltransferase RsmH [Bacteroidetes bacterium]|nr:MAG: 16S rRNA (cytosine(1402)-N(4))-methyltransferase RsmH [Bacteroidota bacterium]